MGTFRLLIISARLPTPKDWKKIGIPAIELISPRSWVKNAIITGTIQTAIRIKATVHLLGSFMYLLILSATARATSGDAVITLNAGNNIMIYSIM